jgi:hypothetical protein
MVVERWCFFYEIASKMELWLVTYSSSCRQETLYKVP